MTVALYDKFGFNENILLDLPFREGVGTITQDVSKYHRPVTLVNTPTWTTIASGLPLLDFDAPSDEYFEIANADSAELDFTSGDYSLGGWVNYSGGDNCMLLARYELDVSGWELYLYNSILQLRHNHATSAPGRTAVYSSNWSPSTWWFLGVSRTGATAAMYRNGVSVTVSGDSLIDPETSAEDLINCRFTKDTDFMHGPVWKLRAWDEALTADDWLAMYEIEKGWFA